MTVKDECYVFPTQPMYLPPSASIVKKLNNDASYVAEAKANGWRCLVRVDGDGQIFLWTRHATLITDPLHALRGELEGMKLPHDSIFDGELLEHRGKTKGKMVLWGAYRLNGSWLNDVPYGQVTDMVRKIMKPGLKHVSYVDSVLVDKIGFYKALISGKMGEDYEGIVIKNLKTPAPFSVSRPVVSSRWLKVKPKETK